MKTLLPAMILLWTLFAPGETALAGPTAMKAPADATIESYGLDTLGAGCDPAANEERDASDTSDAAAEPEEKAPAEATK